MKKHSLMNCINDPECHSYEVTIGTDIGQFTGKVYCREEDWGRESRFFGFELAEIKAEILYARAKKKLYDAKAAALSEFLFDMSQTRTYERNTFWVKKINHRIADYIYQRSQYDELITKLQTAYKNKIDTWDRVVSKSSRCKEYNND